MSENRITASIIYIAYLMAHSTAIKSKQTISKKDLMNRVLYHYPSLNEIDISRIFEEIKFDAFTINYKDGEETGITFNHPTRDFMD